ncbi:MAG: hypothetical protein Kow0077_03200 [Anaerolineae bacterium]
MAKESRYQSAWRLLSQLLPGLIYGFFVRPQILRWGTRLGESQRRLPGDERIVAPTVVATRAINIDAPPEAVWPWLAQMGRERTGWYSFDLLDNNGIPSATYIRKDLNAPEPGTLLDNGLRVLEVIPNRQLLIGASDVPLPFGTAMDVTALYLLERMSDGSTRLLVRTRAHLHGRLGRVLGLLLEPLDFVMGVRQLQGLKVRSESMAYLKIQPPVQHEISLN